VSPSRRAALAAVSCALALAAQPRAAAARGCHEVSSVVGYRHCSHFGWWSEDLADLTATTALSAHLMDLSSMRLGGTVPTARGEQGFVLPGTRFGNPSLLAVTADGEFDVHLAPQVYLGAVVQLGAAPLQDGSPIVAGGVTLTPQDFYYVGLGAHLGALVDVHWLRLRADVLVGTRGLGVQLSETLAQVHQADLQVWEWSVLVTPRAIAEIWLSPWVTAGGYVGVDLVPEGVGWSWGLLVQAHWASFDGAGRR
jgi:hypothetical protein